MADAKGHPPQQQQQQQQKGHAPKIAELKPYEKNLNLIVILLEKGPPQHTSNGVITSALVADQSGCIQASFWDGCGEPFQPGDIIRLNGGYVSLFKGSMVLYAGKHGTMEKVGEFTMLFSESPNMSNLQWVKDPNNPRALIPAHPPKPSTPTGATVPQPRPHT